jgi:hypothetical protein
MLPAAVIFALLVLVASLALAGYTADPHWCQRGGALLAAIAAFMAIFEASIEHNFRQFTATRTTQARDMAAAAENSLSMIERVRLAKFRSRSKKLSHDKLRAVFWISSIAVVGELFHGFGDLIYEGCENVLHWVLMLASYAASLF